MLSCKSIDYRSKLFSKWLPILKAYIHEANAVEKAGLKVNFKKTILQNYRAKSDDNPKSLKEEKMKQQQNQRFLSGTG